MPRLRVNGADLFYEDTASPGESIVFAHGLLWSSRMYDNQVAALRDRYRCIAFDFRGQGQSEVTPSGYDMETLAQDAAALIEALRAAPCHFVGLSMGGFAGMRVAARRPELIRTLTLLSTSADQEPFKTALRLRGLAFVARRLSFRLVGWRAMHLMFGSTFLSDPARVGERQEWKRRLLANDGVGISRAALGVVRRRPVVAELDRITAPTLILVGEEDRLTPPAKARRIHERIAGSRLAVFPGAGHTLTVEALDAVNAALAAHLDRSHSPP